MIRRARGCLTGLLTLVVLVAVAWAGWRWGPAVFPALERWTGGEEEVVPGASPELADETLDRLERLRAGEGPEVLSLGDAELSSVIRYALPGVVPPGVDRPAVQLRDDRMVLSARVALEAFPDLPSMEQVVGLLPDTVDIRMTGRLHSFGRENLSLRIESMEAAGIPLPDRMIPRILTSLGRRDTQGLPAHAILIPVPEGLASVQVQNDSLVLVSDR